VTAETETVVGRRASSGSLPRHISTLLQTWSETRDPRERADVTKFFVMSKLSKVTDPWGGSGRRFWAQDFGHRDFDELSSTSERICLAGTFASIRTHPLVLSRAIRRGRGAK
jgi:hypothetical protein